MDDPGPESLLLTPSELVIRFAAIAVFIFCSAFISACETAFFSLSPEDLDKINGKSPSRGIMVSRLLKKPKKLLATFVIANTFTNISIIILFFRYADDVFYSITNSGLRLFIQVVIITFFLLLFGDVLPKVYAARNSAKVARKSVNMVYVLSKLLSPLSIPMREITLMLHRKLGGEKQALSVDQLSQALELTDYGDTTHEEQRLLEGIVAFGNTDARQVMSPRIDLFALDISEPFSEVLPRIVEKGFSRIPVYEGNIDSIKGVLFVKDLIPHIEDADFAWQDIIREPFFVPETKKLDDLLREFQGMKNHLAVVVDEYGGTSGIISLEDILEEIVGDISDEFDDEDIIYSRIDDYNFLFDGKINIKDFCRITALDEDDFEEAKGEAETLAGFMLEQSGNFPKKGQKIKFKGNIFTVESFDKRRIRQIKVTLKHDSEQPE
ncbi:gliding motility-associated protein GldE [Flavobacterium sp. J372]|uniref:gliding motility-associated protein GldE n=1 Tax=Flavobacterium sp. J372 TaxID=2898436 RepID=UPI002150DF5D|nr:gliding motility-associated protein GldE [Flavobacterium sp. J372]MCR5861347.1 gliding motility-associated protein GldE [Flavobacterium sp. J372]